MAINETDHLLACLAEECAEVSQRVAKALRFGVNEVQPEQGLTNAERIVDELADLLAIVAMLQERDIIGRWKIAAVEAKKSKVLHFMKYAASIGAMEPRAAECAT
jgi:NTP pyrophosphatase (non-canonical NTP hydrolase)